MVLPEKGVAEMSVVPRIRIAECDNYHSRVFHTSTVLSTTSTMMLHFPLQGKERDNLPALGPFGCWLALKLASVLGITQLGIKAYELGVTISPAFTWEEVEGKVIEVLKECFGTEKDEVEVLRE